MDTGIDPDHHTEVGIAGGVALVLLSMTTLQLIETLLAILGAVVSFTTSVGLKWVWKQRERKRSGKK